MIEKKEPQWIPFPNSEGGTRTLDTTGMNRVL